MENRTLAPATARSRVRAQPLHAPTAGDQEGQLCDGRDMKYGMATVTTVRSTR